jgi:hypothetical protein
VKHPSDAFVERVRDEGQWFDGGMRVDFFRTASDPARPTLEKAALGVYEVLGCTRVTDGDRRWLDVRVRRIAPAWTAARDSP